jgi:hypothetical protein
MKRWGPRPSPALVIACLALFVALGGTVLAATKIDGRTIRVASLPGNRLTVRSLPGNRLRPGTVAGNRLVPGSVKGADIDASSLGPVPSAQHADSADTARRAQTATAADHAADATTINGRSVGCAAGTREYAGACWDLQPSPAAVTVVEAAADCADVGGELPDTFALLAFTQKFGIAIAVGGEWTDQVANISAPDQVAVATISPNRVIEPTDWKKAERFRCVTPFLG